MKIFSTLATIATLLTANAFAQTGPEYLTITVSGDSMPQPVSMIMEFSDYGDNSYDQYDTTSLETILNGPVGSQIPVDTSASSTVNSIFPFTISSNLTYINKYDSRPVLESTSVFYFGLESSVSDSITIVASSFIDNASTNLSANEIINYVYLEDMTSGFFYQILDNNVTLAIPVNSTFAKNYRLHVMAKPSIQTFPATCFGSNNGVIAIHNPLCTNWNFTIYPLQTISVFNVDTTLYGFTSDFYTVTVYIDGLLADSEKVLVDGPEQIVPSFIPDNYSVFTNDPVLFMNTTSGADTYSWTFGDNATDSILNPTHSFLSAGNYPVTVTATNLNGCNASFTDTIFVADPTVIQGPTATRGNTISNNPTERMGNSPDVKVVSGSQKITVNQNGEGQEILVQIMNVNGQLISSTSTMSQSITFDFLQAGIYLVTITSTNGEMVSEKIIVNN